MRRRMSRLCLLSVAVAVSGCAYVVVVDPLIPDPQFGYPAGASRLHAIGGAPEYRFASAIAAASGDRGAGTAR